MRIAVLTLATMMLASCGHMTPKSDDGTQKGTGRPTPTPTRSDHGLVTGKTLHITYRIPGILIGKPSKPIPPRAIASVDVYFQTGTNTFKATSGSDGVYSIELPPGDYRIGWILPWQKEHTKNLDPFRAAECLREEIKVEAGKTYEIYLPVSIMFVD
ncbi:hypothetical protein [Thermosphaera sp.]